MSLFECSHYNSPLLSYDNSNIPLKADLGLVVGPFAGASVELFGGYAIANDWLMPASSNGTYFRPIDMKGWHAGIAARYSYRRLLEVAASFEMAPQKENRGYYLWRDRAKQVASIELTVNPIEKLSINAGWEYRGKRQNYIYTPEWAANLMSAGAYDSKDLNNLKLGARYSFTDAFSVFANMENLLGKKWLDINEVRCQGVNGLVGVGYKF